MWYPPYPYPPREQKDDPFETFIRFRQFMDDESKRRKEEEKARKDKEKAEEPKPRKWSLMEAVLITGWLTPIIAPTTVFVFKLGWHLTALQLQ
jgi:hypothetical protein